MSEKVSRPPRIDLISNQTILLKTLLTSSTNNDSGKLSQPEKQDYWNEVARIYPITKTWKVITPNETNLTTTNTLKQTEPQTDFEISIPDSSKQADSSNKPVIKKRKFITLYSDEEECEPEIDPSEEKTDESESSVSDRNFEDDDEDWNQRRRPVKRKRNIKCQLCSFLTKRKQTMRAHMQKHHSSGDKPYKCDKCSYSCSGASNLSKHARIHTGEKPFKCPICPYESSSSSNMSKHIRNHAKRKGNLTCDVCEKEFPNQQQLEAHIVTHAGLKPYQGRSMAQSDSDAIQSDVSGDKLYPCHLCSYKSTTTARLKTHLMTHTGEKPHKCGQCTLAFRERGSLTRHMRVHSGEKPYKCHICPYRCRVRGNLKQHVLIHTGEMPYKCATCSYKCRSKTQMNKHVATFHSEKRENEKTESETVKRIVIEF